MFGNNMPPQAAVNGYGMMGQMPPQAAVNGCHSCAGMGQDEGTELVEAKNQYYWGAGGIVLGLLGGWLIAGAMR